jgi:hypoxanthine phosphoribosyltransferase
MAIWKESTITPKKIHCGWGTLDRACKHIAKSIQFNINCIVGVSRGGLVPATILAHRLNVRELHTIGIRSYNLDHICDHAEIYQNCFKNCKDIYNGKNILIVDDISDRGNTFLKVMEEARKCQSNINILTACIYARETTDYTPHFFYKKIKSEWVVFPYEK